MQTGLVKKRPSRPRNGATGGGPEATLTKCSATMPARGGNLAIGADPADVVRVAQAVDGDAMLFRGIDGPFDRLAGDHLAVAGMRVPDRDRAGIGDDLRLLVRLQGAALEIPDIGDQHADAVAVMAAQIGLDQMVGDDLGLRGLLPPAATMRVASVRSLAWSIDHALTPFSLRARGRVRIYRGGG